MKKDLVIPAIISLLMMAIFTIVSRELTIVLLFVPAVLISYLLYWKTAYRQLPIPAEIVPLYLLALALQLIHFAEEYVMGFNVKAPELLDLPPFSMNYWVIFAMTAFAVFILGGIILLKEIKVLMILPLFFVVGGVLMNLVGHILLALYVGGYFPGLYTALLYLLIAPKLMGVILNR